MFVNDFAAHLKYILAPASGLGILMRKAIYLAREDS